MLVLTRRVGQSIIIGNSVKLTVTEAGKSRVKIGIDAPREVAVHREEMHQRETSCATGSASREDAGRTAAHS